MTNIKKATSKSEPESSTTSAFEQELNELLKKQGLVGKISNFVISEFEVTAKLTMRSI